MLRAYVRRKQYEAKILVSEIAKLFGSPAASSSAAPTPAPAQEQTTYRKVPAHEALKIMGVSIERSQPSSDPS